MVGRGKRSTAHKHPVGQKQKREALGKKKKAKAQQMSLQAFQRALEREMQQGPKKRTKGNQQRQVSQIAPKRSKAKAVQEKRAAAI